MFIGFESYYLYGFLVLVCFLLFVIRYIEELIQDFFVSLYYHFYSVFYPRRLIIVNLFLFIVFINVYGLIPRCFSISSLPLISLRARLIMWIGGFLYVFYLNTENVIGHFLPIRSPMVLSVFLVWIEIISWLCRPLALRIRLIANITAGHLLIFLFRSGVFFSGMYFLCLFLFMLVLLEIRVCFIQGYVYQLLLSLYVEEGL